MPLLAISSARTIRACLNPPPFDGRTVFIASYPKSGTTWTQNIVVQLLLKQRYDFSHISEFAPFYEADKHWEDVQGNDGTTQLAVKDKFVRNHQLLGTRVFNTHLLPSMLPRGDSVKQIYVYRKGRDVATSFFHHLSNEVGEDSYSGDFSQFVREWSSGVLPYGKWIDHVWEWREQALNDGSQIFMISYEEMVCDLPASLRKFADFLEVELTDQELDLLLPKLTFSGMKSELSRFQPISVRWKEGFEFLRHGVIGEGNDMFTEDDNNLFERAMSDSVLMKMDPTFANTLL
jgi:hypothetical protein